MKRNPGIECFEGIALEKWRCRPKGLQLPMCLFHLQVGLSNASRWKDVQLMLWAAFSFPLGLVELLLLTDSLCSHVPSSFGMSDAYRSVDCGIFFETSGCWFSIFYLDIGGYSIPCIPFRVCEMGLKAWYSRQGVKCDSTAATAAIPQHFASALCQNSLVSLVWKSNGPCSVSETF